MRLIYLASPYTHKSKYVRNQRRLANQAACAFFTDEAYPNILVYSPLAHWGQIADQYGLPPDFDFWAQRDFFIIQKSSAVWVLPLDGWQNSKGISLELEYARDINRPVQFIQDQIDKSTGESYLYLTAEEERPGNVRSFHPREFMSLSRLLIWRRSKERATAPSPLPK